MEIEKTVIGFYRKFLFLKLVMYTLYWHPYASSYAAMAVLEELGVPYDTHEVDYDGGETLTAEYLRLHPLGFIPVLGFANGASMFESAAIIQHLCDRHPEAGLAPSVDDDTRPCYLQWLFYMADTLYPSYNRYYHPDRYTASAKDVEGVKVRAHRMALQQWRIVDDALRAGGPWLLKDRFSACDIYLQMISTWHESPADLLSQFPHVRELARGVVAREGCRRALHRHKFGTGFPTVI